MSSKLENKLVYFTTLLLDIAFLAKAIVIGTIKLRINIAQRLRLLLSTAAR